MKLHKTLHVVVSVVTLALAACAGTPSASSTAPATSSGTVASVAPADATVSQTEREVAANMEESPAMINGYRRSVRGGQEFYCKTAKVLGSRLNAAESC